MNETIKLLKQLIKINSPSGKETKLANFIYNWLKNQKIKPIKQNGNVLVHIKGDSQHKAIIFNGHMDTVSPGDLKKWQYEPFNPTIVKDKLYGLGTSDMKGAVASMMFLAKNLIKNKPICDVWFSFVTKEELDGSGTKNFLKWFKQKGFLNQYQLISAVIGEATGLKKIELGHKGNAFVHVTITGQTGHGSQPEKIKRHAILQMNELITKLNQKIPYWQKKYKDKFLGIPTVGLTGIKAGLFKCPNKFPDKCKAQFDFRTTPAMHQNIDNEIKNWLKGTKATYNFAVKPAPFGWCNPKELIVKTIQEIIPNIKLSISQGATDQCFFTSLNIPAIIFGPGEKSICHKENEWINIHQLSKVTEIYQKIINQLAQQIK